MQSSRFNLLKWIFKATDGSHEQYATMHKSVITSISEVFHLKEICFTQMT